MRAIEQTGKTVKTRLRENKLWNYCYCQRLMSFGI